MFCMNFSTSSTFSLSLAAAFYYFSLSSSLNASPIYSFKQLKALAGIRVNPIYAHTYTYHFPEVHLEH